MSRDSPPKRGQVPLPFCSRSCPPLLLSSPKEVKTKRPPLRPVFILISSSTNVPWNVLDTTSVFLWRGSERSQASAALLRWGGTSNSTVENSCFAQICCNASRFEAVVRLVQPRVLTPMAVLQPHTAGHNVRDHGVVGGEGPTLTLNPLQFRRTERYTHPSGGSERRPSIDSRTSSSSKNQNTTPPSFTTPPRPPSERTCRTVPPRLWTSSGSA